MLQKSITKVIAGQGGSYGLKGVLLCTSWLYKLGLKTKQTFDNVLWYKSPKVSVPVVCIGNIIAGGSGKTPLLQRIISDLKECSPESVAVVSRGYKGEYNKKIGVLHLNGERELTSQACGDEAYMLYKKFPRHAFFVGKNRYNGAKQAVCNGAKLILLDDGMQNTTLFHDLKIVVLHADRLLGGQGVQRGFFLPRGSLRDFPSSLKKAHYVVVNHAYNKEQIEAVAKALKTFVSCPIIYSQMRVRGYFDERGEVTLPQGSRIGVFCGLGSPSTFVDGLKREGMDVAKHWFLSDHQAPSVDALDKFILRAKAMGCKTIVCTEKDWVKLIKKEGYALPICRVKSDLSIVSGINEYEELLEVIQELMRERI